MRTYLYLCLLLLTPSLLAAQSGAAKTLDIYLIDTEGGQATLFVTPSGESVLVDTGNPGDRDTGRILATLREANVKRIDHLLLTHYHIDHVGGVEALARQIPILHYLDHGATVEPGGQGADFLAAYDTLRRGARHTVVKPGDRLAIPGLEWDIVSSAGQVLQQPLRGAGQTNEKCASFSSPEVMRDLENGQSVGSVIRFGAFRAVDLGDLLAKQEFALMCPVNRIGTVDLYITSHHGLGISGTNVLVHALRPRVAVMNNGARKGGAVQAFQVLHTSPGLEDLWQLHWSGAGGSEQNAPGIFIANLDEPGTPHSGPAYSIKVSAREDGSFVVTNTRNGFSKTYGAAE
jgi:beta-lactamase superfamily II metal-dependent hydrolase